MSGIWPDINAFISRFAPFQSSPEITSGVTSSGGTFGGMNAGYRPGDVTSSPLPDMSQLSSWLDSLPQTGRTASLVSLGAQAGAPPESVYQPGAITEEPLADMDDQWASYMNQDTGEWEDWMYDNGAWYR